MKRKMEVPYLDLKSINSPYKERFKSNIDEIFDSGWILLGVHTQRLEDNLSLAHHGRYSLGVSNGLDALRLIFRGYMELGLLSKGDRVIVPANTYIASVLPLFEFGLVPILVEPDIRTMNLDFNLIDDELLNTAKAIVIVHLYGRICYSEKIKEIKKRGLLIIEDNAQSIGAYLMDANGSKVVSGSIGDAAGFSFYPGKNTGSFGDAGAVICKDKSLYDVIKALRNYGSKVKYFNKYTGYNCRISEANAAFANLKLDNLDEINSNRRIIARYYIDNIQHSQIDKPEFDFDEHENTSHVWHIFHLLIKNGNRDEFQEYLKEHGIGTVVHYPVPIYKQEALVGHFSNLNLPVTDHIHDSVISIPLYETMSMNHVEYVVEVINQW